MGVWNSAAWFSYLLVFCLLFLISHCLQLLPPSSTVTSRWKTQPEEPFRRDRDSFSPGGVGDVDSSEVDALAAHDEEGGEAEKRHSAADHCQLGRLASPQLQLLDDVPAQHDAHAGAGHDDHTWADREAVLEELDAPEGAGRVYWGCLTHFFFFFTLQKCVKGHKTTVLWIHFSLL